TLNASTGFSPFQLHLGHSPHVLPPFSETQDTDPDSVDAVSFLSQLELDILEAQDNLLTAKAQQAHAA
ncbi:hypothetical protein SCLCIDRAFT_97862, partial [Scleroderma citrinum Foug A]